jgi:hypothetical protein
MPDRPEVEPRVEDGWVNKHGYFFTEKPARAMSDEFRAMSGIVPGKRYIWPASVVIERTPDR